MLEKNWHFIGKEFVSASAGWYIDLFQFKSQGEAESPSLIPLSLLLLITNINLILMNI